VQHRHLLALMLLVSCTTGVEEGLFASSVTASATNATTIPATSSDDGRAESSDGDTGPVDPTATPHTTDDPATSSAGDDAPPPVDTSGDPTLDPTIVPGDSSSGDPTLDPSGNEESTGVDPTGVDPTGVDPTGVVAECCDALAVPGCGDATLEACVCGVDDYCCSDAWDDFCVGEAADYCGAACMGVAAGDCCSVHDDVGCDDATIESCVCSLDDYCCSSDWDDFCVSEASDCGAPC
jgi:hypothetical protein